ncbi:lipase maturation factor 1-like [Centruroides sculpturatus]|uniref:lipase maturation factor 1-like n=1 Tax=Centruroides sculpturatus TaxID=218467 RepID=UPI000C6E988A|nr:lipase maturation factor 1-like [Centruroides sculpturatus]
MAAPNGGNSQQLRRRNVARDVRQTNSNRLIKEEKENKCVALSPNSYWLNRILFLHCLGFIYSVAFLVACHQNKALLGRNGLLPVHLYLKQIKEQAEGNPFQCFFYAPTLLWLVDKENIDFYLDLLAYTGLVISLLITVTGCSNMIAMITLWILYHSIVNVGQRWYSFGWESQLLETGFLAIFFCPLWTWKRLPRNTPPSPIVVWGYRWLLFRIMIGAGLIKIRGDRCWLNLTCMNYHYEKLTSYSSITKVRTEVIIEGTYDHDPSSPTARWEEYEFKCKPGNTTKTPCLISPYHYRLDWLMWFAAFQNYQYNPWLIHLAVKLLENDDTVMSLISFNPFEGRKPPKFIRAEHYHYTYTKIGSEEAKNGHWWKRKHVANYLPPVSLGTLSPVVKRFGWKSRTDL